MHVYLRQHFCLLTPCPALPSAQEKYRRKKAKKYLARVMVVRPTARALAETHFGRGHPGRTGALRADALALLLSLANVGAGAHVLVADGCSGLVAGA